MFWDGVQSMYQAQELLERNEDPKLPEGFFNKVWAERGREYREIVEPLEIADWCVQSSIADASMEHACSTQPSSTRCHVEVRLLRSASACIC